ncbi:MAG: peptidase T [Oscillospiraceae bacterium]|nr:peptidase T [Oscillospiraceae bacterium]
MRAYERFIKYAVLDTQSCEDANKVPSTEKQFRLAELLKKELEALGLERVEMSENAYVYAYLPASEGMENEPAIGLIAHLDTATDFSGTNVRPLIHEGYNGRDISLGFSGLVLSAREFPDLKDALGHKLITSDGTTLLGADDKAGIAEIITACERIIEEKLPHCALALCFTPDEEIGHGAELLDLERLGADFAYTLDGDAVNELSYETFNAASAKLEIKGVNVHPGSAKNIMVNASLVAMEINSMLPEEEIPAETEGYEGFFHLMSIQGSVEKASMEYIIRDHDAGNLARRCQLIKGAAELMNYKYGDDTVSIEIKSQYRNMAEVLTDRMDIVERAKAAIEKAGLKPVLRPIRGGTDGAQLSFRGLPCPNLGTGGFGFHGPYEHITAENMDKAVEIILNIAACGR